MKRTWTCIAVAVAAVSGILWFALRKYVSDPRLSELVVRIVLAFFTFCAVLLALFGDQIREWIDPIRVRIETFDQDETDDFLNKCKIGETEVPCYTHHLLVRNLARHRPLRDCRVWLERILINNADGKWAPAPHRRFAVPRLMRWAPFEYSDDKRTFATRQVLDLGKTISNNLGFEIEVWRGQGGVFDRKVEVGKTVRFVFCVTADNYHRDEEFIFEVSVLPSNERGAVTPSIITQVFDT